MTRRKTLQERFDQYVDRTGECWVWTAYRNKLGYGVFGITGGSRLAHRVAYSMVHGEISKGLEVCHRCDNPSCVRVDHLFLGTHAENMADSALKGRSRAPHGQTNKAAKLTDEAVLEILNSSLSAKHFSRKFNVSDTAIGLIRKNLKWKHVSRDGVDPSKWKVSGENHHKAKLTAVQVVAIKDEYAKLAKNGRLPSGAAAEIAKRYGVHVNYPRMLAKGDFWKVLEK